MTEKSSVDDRLTILISSPLETEHVDRIRAFAPDRVAVIHAPELLATPRYVADHHGIAPQLTDAEMARWESYLARADISFDFDFKDPANMPLNAPRLKWVQATSAGHRRVSEADRPGEIGHRLHDRRGGACAASDRVCDAGTALLLPRCPGPRSHEGGSALAALHRARPGGRSRAGRGPRIRRSRDRQPMRVVRHGGLGDAPFRRGRATRRGRPDDRSEGASKRVARNRRGRALLPVDAGNATDGRCAGDRRDEAGRRRRQRFARRRGERDRRWSKHCAAATSRAPLSTYSQSSRCRPRARSGSFRT